jgi:hypothetical protein
MRKAVRLLVAALMVAGLVGAAGAAQASGGDDQEVINRGDCSQFSDWKLRIRTDGPDLLDLEFEAGEVAGQTWRVRMTYNGSVVFSGNAVSGADGEFDVDREVANQAGQDTLQGVARNLQTGETCRGSVTADF